MAAKRRSVDELLRTRRRVWPEAVTPVSELMVRVFRLSALVYDAATATAASHGLSFTEFEVLVTLRGVGAPYELVPTDLYSAILISSGGLTKVLHGLQKRGLVSRPSGGGDRRSKPVRLTAKGRLAAERAMADVLESDRELIFNGLSEAEVALLTRLLRKLLATLEPVDA
ncbi:MAG TPA: MarR family transcriptional regulator [Bradyrhizobium sp.]|nr:MarR family transcriptional regulator [Bradyrhizobium sp.]